MKERQVVVIAGPAGSGKDSIIKGILSRFPNTTRTITATTRTMRPGEKNGVDYRFLTNKRFKEELKAGNIPEFYHRKETDTYYGTYKPDLEARIADGKIVLCQLQIVGAKYLKKHYNAVTIFILPTSLDEFERRIRARSPMTDVEWRERVRFTKQEVEEEARWYDYKIINADGKLSKAVGEVVAILKKEGYTLG